MACFFWRKEWDGAKLAVATGSGREILEKNYGKPPGCELGNSCWEIYCLEHKIRSDGVVCNPEENRPPQEFFVGTGADKVAPKAIFVDLDSYVIDEIRRGPFRSLYRPNLLLSGKEDAANCFALGYFRIGQEMIDPLIQQIHSLTEECNAVQGFLIFRAYGGGTGSGLVASLLEHLYEEYPRTSRIEFSLYPSPKLSSIIVEPYNAALATHESLDHTTASFLMDNEACYDICDRLLDTCSPSFPNINRLMAQVISSMTTSLRGEGNINLNLREIETNLIPFPRVHYPIISYAPFISRRQALYQNITESFLINSCFEPANQIIKCDTRKGKYMACTVLLRGNVTDAVVNSAIHTVKTKKSKSFVDWSPGLKVGVNNVPPMVVPGGDLALVDRDCTMLANSTAIKTAWTKLNCKFDVMLSRKSYLHWYISEGLEEADFHNARLNLGALINDYAEAENDV